MNPVQISPNPRHIRRNRRNRMAGIVGGILAGLILAAIVAVGVSVLALIVVGAWSLIGVML